MSKQKSLAFFQSPVLLGLMLLYYVLYSVSKSPFQSIMLQTPGLHALEHCPLVAMATEGHPPNTFLRMKQSWGELKPGTHLSLWYPHGVPFMGKRGQRPRGTGLCFLGLIKHLGSMSGFCLLALHLCRKVLPTLDSHEAVPLGCWWGTMP